MSTTVRERALNRAFVEFAGSLVSEFDVADLMSQLVTLVTDLLGADAAGILLRDVPGELQVVASSTEAARLLGNYELQSGQGPGLDCIRTGKPVSIPDLDVDADRWPLFVPTAHEQDCAAVHALPMRVRNEVIGALSLFSGNRGDLSRRDLDASQALADVATIAILHERASHHDDEIVEETQEMLHARFVVEQAKGMVAAGGVGMDEAYDLLRHFARYRDARLVEVATDLAAGRIQPAVIIAAGRLGRS